jgi:hypothetical protein
MRVNGERSHVIENDYTKINVSSWVINGSFFNVEFEIIRGEYDFFPNKFELQPLNPHLKFQNGQWQLNNELITEDIHLGKGDVLHYMFLGEFDGYPPANSSISFIILPNNSLMSGESPILSDTITVKRRRE